MNFLEKTFQLNAHKSSVPVEFGAAISTFLAMVYIIPVNATILSIAGLPKEGLLVATALITIIATAFNGFFANTPVAMSVGMGLNAYFTFTLCTAQKVAPETALGAVFLSGLFFLILSFTKFRLWIVASIPLDLRRAISAGIGCFLAFLGLKSAGIVVSNPDTALAIGNLGDKNVLLALFTLLLIVCFWAWRLRAGFILAVLIASAAAWLLGLSPLPSGYIALPNFSGSGGFLELLFALDVKAAFSLSLVPAILTIFVTQLFDTVGTLTGLGVRSGIFDGEKGDKKLGKTMIADAASTCTGALLGVSTVTAFVESSAGVEAGGRTGLCAVFIAAFFALALFFLPFFGAIPANAIYPILIMVGILMFMETANIDFKDNANCVATFFIVIMMPFTFSITTGFAFGFVTYLLVRIFKGEFKQLNAGIITISLICLAVFLLQFI